MSRVAAWGWLWVACHTGGDAGVDGETGDATLVGRPPVVTPSPAWPDGQPLRCDGDGLPLAWTLDGQPFDGAQATVVAGDTIPADLLAAGQTWSCETAAGRAEVTIRPPSVVLVVADDLGWGDLSPYGGRLPTPAVERLADEGITFATTYAAAPVCGPARVGLLTGREPARTGMTYNVSDNAAEAQGRGLPPLERTLGEVLGSAGLTTAYVGKWHLGVNAAFHPNQRGYGHFYGFLDGRRLALPPDTPGLLSFDLRDDEVATWPLSPAGEALTDDGVVVDESDGVHLTTRLGAHAASWLVAHADEDVFLTLAFSAPHLPLLATPEQVAAVGGDPAYPLKRLYDANVALLDAALAEVLTALEASGMASHTLVVVTSDNGCLPGNDICSNGPFVGGKLALTEGGLRVPMLARWPGQLTPGAVEARRVSTLDLLPTLAGAVGAVVPADRPIDGVDLRPYLGDPGMAGPHPVLDFRMAPARARIAGESKVVQVGETVWRFDLGQDPYESTDLHALDPAGSVGLLDALDAREEVDWMPSLWPGRQGVAVYYGTLASILF